MSTRAMRRPTSAVTLMVAVAASASACGGAVSLPTRVPTTTTAAAQAPAQACLKLPEAVLPHSAGMLTEQQAGAYCLPRGQRVDIFLASVKGSQWQPVQADRTDILAPASTGVLTAPLGVTPAMFIGKADGVTVLTSHTAAGAAWRVTLIVQG